MFKTIRTSTVSVIGRGAAAALRRRSPTLDGVALVDHWTLGGVGPRTVDFLAAQIATRRPRRILECGPGTSTVAMARAAEVLGLPTRIVALEHDHAWAAIVRRRIEACGLGDRVEIIASPLEPRGSDPMRWYSGAAEAAKRGPFDLMFIDGPPARDGVARREPALPRMWSALADNALVVLDDGRRAGERECVRRWKDRYGARLDGELAAVEKGLWALEKLPAGAADGSGEAPPWAMPRDAAI